MCGGGGWGGGGHEQPRALRLLASHAASHAFGPPRPWSSGTLNRHGLQTLSSGTVELHVNTVVHQQQLATQQVPVTAQKAAEVKERSLNANSVLRALAGARTLGASETAADRVKRRLAERRSQERLPGGSAPPTAAAAEG